MRVVSSPRFFSCAHIVAYSVIFRPTETKGQFYFIFGAHLNYSEFVADHAKLVQAMRDFIKRDDIKIGKVKYAVEYKSVAVLVSMQTPLMGLQTTSPYS